MANVFPVPRPQAAPARPAHGVVDLSIIIVSWNVWDLLRSCLASIERVSRPSEAGAQGAGDETVRLFGPPIERRMLEVIVVDSASSDATVDGLRALFPWVRVIASAENLGFTRGNNLGYAQSRGSFVFFLNPDTELVADSSSDSLWTLFAALDQEPGVGVVGPQLRYGDGTLQSSRRRFPTRWTGFFESTWLGLAWPQNPWVRRLHMADWPATIRHDVDWVMGSAMLCRRAALEAVPMTGSAGPFDEGFFMYSEELDLCRRIKEAGWRVVYVPEAVIIHYEGRSSGQVVAARHIHFNTSKVRYYHKWFGPVWAEGLRQYLLIEFRMQLLVEQIKLRLGHKPQLRTARVQAYRQVLQSQLCTPAQSGGNHSQPEA
jgi:N-acetylglucosaminyl-diphospho-decaprenol L-rhamnosyltransferase